MTKLNQTPQSQARELRRPAPVRLACVGGLLDGLSREDVGERLEARSTQPMPRAVAPHAVITDAANRLRIIYRKVEFANSFMRRRFYVLECMSEDAALANINSKGLM